MLRNQIMDEFTLKRKMFVQLSTRVQRMAHLAALYQTSGEQPVERLQLTGVLVSCSGVLEYYPVAIADKAMILEQLELLRTLVENRWPLDRSRSWLAARERGIQPVPSGEESGFSEIPTMGVNPLNPENKKDNQSGFTTRHWLELMHQTQLTISYILELPPV